MKSQQTKQTQGKEVLEDTQASQQIEDDTSLAARLTYRIGLAYGRFVYRLRWPIIIFWFIVLLAGAPFASQVSSVLSGGGYELGGSESVQADTQLINKLHFPPSTGIVVFQSSDTAVTDPAYQNEIHSFINQTKQLAHVTSVVPEQIGRDGRTTYVAINFDLDTDHVQQETPLVAKLLPNSPARTYLTGDLAVYDAFSQLGQADIEQADAFALPIALLLLLFAFGSLVAALAPLVLTIFAVPTALVFIYFLAQHQITSSSVLSVASVIGLGLSIDYSLLMTRRFRDELLRRATVQEAVAWTVTTAGEAILFSGLAVIIGFCGLLLLNVQFMTTFGLSGAFVVFTAVLTALTLLPALFSVLGNKINALRIPFLNRGLRAKAQPDAVQPASSPVSNEHGFWHRWAMGVMKRPILIVVLTLILIFVLGWPIFSLKIGIPSYTSLPAGTPARQGLTILQDQVPSVQESPINLVVQTPDGSNILTSDNLQRLSNLTQWVGSHEHITTVTSLFQGPGLSSLTSQQLTTLYTSGAYKQNPALARLVAQFANGDTTLIIATSDTKLDSDAGNALIDQLRSGQKTAGQGLNVKIGGTQAVTLDINRYLYNNFLKTILFVLIATYILLFLMFRSLLLPLKAILMNILSIGVAYGILVYVFQWGNLTTILNFQSEGFIESTIPILLFCILFGLSMDYEVFLLSRIHEEWLRTNNNRQAVALGLENTAGVITNAALVLVIVAGAIAFTSLISTKEIGLGVSAAVLADATIIRLLLVPATMRLLGRWNWWLPGRPLPTEKHE